MSEEGGNRVHGRTKRSSCFYSIIGAFLPHLPSLLVLIFSSFPSLFFIHSEEREECIYVERVTTYFVEC